MLAVQAEVLGPGAVSELALLRRNRALRLVRFSVSAAGAVHVEGELPSAAVVPSGGERVLGVLGAGGEGVRGGGAVRAEARGEPAPPSARSGRGARAGWPP